MILKEGEGNNELGTLAFFFLKINSLSKDISPRKIMLYSLILLMEEIWSYLWKQNNLTCGSRLVLLVLGWKQNGRTSMQAEVRSI